MLKREEKRLNGRKELKKKKGKLTNSVFIKDGKKGKTEKKKKTTFV